MDRRRVPTRFSGMNSAIEVLNPDFPRGDFQQLIDSITGKLWPLGDDVAFVSGHGPMSRFGIERKTNGYVADDVLAGD